MGSDDKLKRYQEAGAEFFEAARAKAEEFLHDVSGAGEATQERAVSAVDDLLGGSRRGTEQLFDAIRREIANQLKVLGLATTRDLEDLERRLTAQLAAREPVITPPPVPEPVTVAAATVPARKAATRATRPVAKQAAAAATGMPAKKTVAKKAVARKAVAKKTVAKKTVAAPKAAGTRATPRARP